MIAVTGIQGSGTNCITRLMARFGYDTSTAYPMHNGNRFDTVKGYVENPQTLTINDAILTHAGGNWYNPPADRQILLSGIRYAEDIRNFSEIFNGTVLNDSRMCLTATLWERYSPTLFTFILSLRNPVDVALFLKWHNGIPLDTGLRLWYLYYIRFINGTTQTPVVVVDYDKLKTDFEFELLSLLNEIGPSLTMTEIKKRTGDFNIRSLNHAPITQEQLAMLPRPIARLYEILLSRTYAGCSSEKVMEAAGCKL